MRAFQVLVIVGGILIVIGFIPVYMSIATSRIDTPLTIPAGGDFYYFISLNAFNGMKLAGQYTVTNGGTVDVHILNQAAYDSYSYDLTFTNSLYDSSGVGDSFSVTFPSGGKWYFVLDHGPGFDGTAQDVHVAMNTSGIDVVLLGAGVGLLVVGIALVAVGLMQKKKAVQAMPPVPAPTDVTYFQPPQPPQPPTG